MLVQRALYPDEDLPNMAHIYLMSSAGGVLQGDRLEIAVDAGENTMARITTQSATKIYKMDKGYAHQSVSISALGNSYVEFVPRQLIPFRGSRFCQDVTIKVSNDSTVVYSETVSAGRTASGELFDFDLCFLALGAYNAGRLLFSDVSRIEPGLDKKETFDRLFGGKSIWSSVYIITPKDDREDLESEVRKVIEASRMLSGYTALPNEAGFLVRMLDDSIDKIEHTVSALALIARQHAFKFAQEK
jgi:urease accessory protein